MISLAVVLAVSIKLLNATGKPILSAGTFATIYFLYSLIEVHDASSFISILLISIVFFIINYFWHKFLDMHSDTSVWWIALIVGVVVIVLVKFTLGGMVQPMTTPPVVQQQ